MRWRKAKGYRLQAIDNIGNIGNILCHMIHFYIYTYICIGGRILVPSILGTRY